MFSRQRLGMLALVGLILVTEVRTYPCLASPADFFSIRVIDDQTGRGVPMVKLETTNHVQYFTDSNGLVAYHEPGLNGGEVHFLVSSHGYEYPKDGFGYAGIRLTPVPGGSATIKIKRINIAERLYRVTGQGIYRDTVLLGRRAPTSQPVINGLVTGSDSVLNVEYRGRLYWFWGDTGWPAYPLGNFHVTGATSLLPAAGGLDPAEGVDLAYFTRENGFTKEMAPLSSVGPTWLDSLLVIEDREGRECLYAAYANVDNKMKTLERGLCLFDDEKGLFEKVVEFDLNDPVGPTGHPFRLVVGDEDCFYFGPPALRRVHADADSLRDAGAYQAFTCLQPGSTVEQARVDRDSAGRVRYAWKFGTPPLEPKDERKFVESGVLEPHEVLTHLRDAQTGQPVFPHAGSLYWNRYRQRWVWIVCQIMGTSMLGETWYAEGDTPLGPWVYARKIVTHDRYSFYNPKQHPMFAKENGRVVFFEGTYTHTFSGSSVQTPRYDYNQIMYRLDLADPRLVLPVPVYDTGDAMRPGQLVTRDRLPPDGKPRRIAFFAPDRPAPGLIAVFCGGGNLPTTRPAEADDGEAAAFYALPAEGGSTPPPDTVLLWSWVNERGDCVLTTDADRTIENRRRIDRPLCRVWVSPTSLNYPLD